MDSLLPALAGQALLLCLQVPEKGSLDTTRDNRWRELPQLDTELVAVHQLLLGREQQKHDCRVAFERQAGPLPQAVDCEIEIAGGASRVVPALALCRRAIDELLERSPERHRLFERFDADAHLIAVLNPVVDVEAVHRRTNETAEDRAALSRFSIHATCPVKVRALAELI